MVYIFQEYHQKSLKSFFLIHFDEKKIFNCVHAFSGSGNFE